MKTASQNHPFRHARFLLCLMSALLLSVSFAGVGMHAQQTTGSLVGTVKDQTGAVVSSATVKATDVATGFSRSVQSDGLGEYRIDFLPVGSYTVEVVAKSFKHFTQQNIDLTVDQTLTLEVPLVAGAALPVNFWFCSTSHKMRRRRR